MCRALCQVAHVHAGLKGLAGPVGAFPLTGIVRLPGHQPVPSAQLPGGEEALARHPLCRVHHAAEGGLHSNRTLLRGLSLYGAGREGAKQVGAGIQSDQPAVSTCWQAACQTHTGSRAATLALLPQAGRRPCRSA